VSPYTLLANNFLQARGHINMSVVYEHRGLMSAETYGAMGDLDHDATSAADHVRYSDQDVADLTAYDPPAAPLMASPEDHNALDLSSPSSHPPLMPTSVETDKDEMELRTPQRIKAIPKPDRPATKNGNGKYECDWPDCTEEVKEFHRKCEWK
jgi:hypothetical protein